MCLKVFMEHAHSETSNTCLKKASTSLDRVLSPWALQLILTSCLTFAEILKRAVATRKPSIMI